MSKLPTWIKIWIGSALVVGIFFAFSIIKNRKRKNIKKILFVGDSITAGKYSYPAIIKKAIPSMTIDVLAIGGKTTQWMLENLPPKLINKYDRVYIYGGINDAFNSSINPKTTISNMQTMIDLINKSGAEPFVILGYEPSGFMIYSKMPLTKYLKKKEDYVPLIKRYENLQHQFKGLSNTSFVSKINLGDMTSDGIHPSQTGQKIIAEKVMETI